ncbi:pentapeptide repeat-containing protein [Stieleria sp. TO1_6]|uniref:pentapeptide repeat-containing protein n=1 Tax=Stieleria tagensis TaxID=2956795 RepID=UPI00209B060B|nr:pentapeptide repeat-containing protein [Stieleria tagensis]MCO8122867.1 pentapeptide repeat-containing protein [Stieleria tagensis]
MQESKSVEPPPIPKDISTKRPYAGYTTLHLAFAIILTAALTFLTSQFAFRWYADYIKQIVVYALGTTAAFLVAALLVVLVWRHLMRNASLREDHTLSDVFGTLSRISNRWLTESESNDVDTLAKQLIAWFAWFRTTKTIFVTATGMLLALAGFFGSSLIVRQNELIEDQSKLLKTQNILARTQIELAESGRRAALIFDLSGIMGQYLIERPPVIWPANRDPTSLETYKPGLPDAAKSRVVALSRALVPYTVVEDDGSTLPEPKSPGRGQLLANLIDSGCDYRPLLSQCDFSNSYLRDAQLNQSKFFQVHFEGSDFRNANLRFSFWRDCFLPEASAFAGADFEGISFQRVFVNSASWLQDLQSVKPPVRNLNIDEFTIGKYRLIDGWQSTFKFISKPVDVDQFGKEVQDDSTANTIQCYIERLTDIQVQYDELGAAGLYAVHNVALQPTLVPVPANMPEAPPMAEPVAPPSDQETDAPRF